MKTMIKTALAVLFIITPAMMTPIYAEDCASGECINCEECCKAGRTVSRECCTQCNGCSLWNDGATRECADFPS